MIGVVAKAEHLEAAAEFFELFKTPWEAAVPGRKYRVLLTTDDWAEEFDADLVLAYGTAPQPGDDQAGVSPETIDGSSLAEWEGVTFPLYTGAAVFQGNAGAGILKVRGRAIDYRRQPPADPPITENESQHRTTWRIGYNLFSEVRWLLTHGQPASFALTPTLELHIAVLRRLLLQSGVSFVEVPPQPGKHEFVCCLTHDVDFFGIKRHKWDRTLAGFVYRGTIGTLFGLLRGRRTIVEAVRNILAVLSLPFVFAGLRRDFWQPFEDYAAADGDRGSTYFLAPFKKLPGVSPDGTTDSVRGVPYAVGDITQEIAKAQAPRTEFALHGIDAWRDVESGRAEIAELTTATGDRRVGVRMHWLYFSNESTALLEAAGFDYDSTCGYNDAIGFKAGTSQVFRPLGRSTLMELPLSIMDSAMFYPGRMEMIRKAALQMCRGIVDDARRFGGTVVINWHDRSLAPERQWNRGYRDLLTEIETGGRAWFATGAEAVEWFRWRRSIRFRTGDASNEVIVESCANKSNLPGARVAIHHAETSGRDVEQVQLNAGDVVHLAL
jgi:hypothetical protein